MSYRFISAFLLLLLSSATQAQSPVPTISYTRDVQPIFTEKCVACHACYDAACQLNLGSAEGAARGASKIPVYNGDRSKASHPKITADSEQAEEMLGEVVATTSRMVSGSATRLAAGGTLTDIWTKKSSTTTKAKVAKLVLSTAIVDSRSLTLA